VEEKSQERADSVSKSAIPVLFKAYGVVVCVISLSYFYRELTFVSVFGPTRFVQGYAVAIANGLFLLSGLAILVPIRVFAPCTYFALVYSGVDHLIYLYRSLTGEIITIQGEFWRNWKDSIVTASFASLCFVLLVLMCMRSVREPFFHMHRTRALWHIALSSIVSIAILAFYSAREYQ
jgi:hypothetical protein